MNVVQAIGKGVAAAAGALSGGGITRAAGAAAGAAAGINFDQGNFLDLLVTQLTNQNPMEPMDNETMVTQMTQLQTVDKLNSLNERMESVMVYQGMMSSIELIGRDVTVFDAGAGEEIIGKVQGVRIEGGMPGVVVNNNFYDIGDVTGIV